MQTQKCNKCPNYYELTTEFFHKESRIKTGFSKTCKICVKTYKKLWIANSGYTQPSFYESCKGDSIMARAIILRSGLVSRSREKNLPFDKSILNTNYIYNWLTQTQSCECCKRNFDFTFKNINNYSSPTIDKFYSSLGYVIGNIHLLCWRCNILKKNYSASKLETVMLWMNCK